MQTNLTVRLSDPKTNSTLNTQEFSAYQYIQEKVSNYLIYFPMKVQIFNSLRKCPGKVFPIEVRNAHNLMKVNAVSNMSINRQGSAYDY